MTVEGVGPVDPVSNLKKVDRADKPRKPPGADSIQVSAEAKYAAEVYHAKELVKNSPDVRADRIAKCATVDKSVSLADRKRSCVSWRRCVQRYDV